MMHPTPKWTYQWLCYGLYSLFFCAGILTSCACQAVLQAVFPVSANVSLKQDTTLDVAYTTVVSSSIPSTGQYCVVLNATVPLMNGVSRQNPCAVPLSAIAVNSVVSGNHELLSVLATTSQQAASQLPNLRGAVSNTFYFVRGFKPAAAASRAAEYAVVKLVIAPQIGIPDIPAYSQPTHSPPIKNESLTSQPSNNLQLNNIQLKFPNQTQQLSIEKGKPLPPISVSFSYKGSGVLRMRWLLAAPSAIKPSLIDLTPLSRLLETEKLRLNSYEQLATVVQYFPPAATEATLTSVLPGIPTQQLGNYQLFLVISEQQSNPYSVSTDLKQLPLLHYTVTENTAESVVPRPDNEANELLVYWPEGNMAAEGLSQLAKQRLILVRQQSLTTLGGVLAQYQLPVGSSPTAVQRMVADIQAQHPAWVVDVNRRLYPQAPTLPTKPQGSIAPIRLYALKQLGLGSLAAPEGVRVGVLDSATNRANSLAVLSFTTKSMLMPSDTPASFNHGNAIASLLAGKPESNGFAGASKQIGLYWASVFKQNNQQENTNSMLVALALDWLLGQNVQVINMSVGGKRDAVLDALFKRALRFNVLFVAAAGNNGAQAAPVYPAAYAGVLAVTAVDANMQVYNEANQGAYIGVAAPGVDVWVPTAVGTNLTGHYVSGTSFASILTVGALTFLPKPFWQMPNTQQHAFLCRAAKDLGAVGKDVVFGCGLLVVKK